MPEAIEMLFRFNWIFKKTFNILNVFVRTREDKNEKIISYSSREKFNLYFIFCKGSFNIPLF